MIYLSGDYEAEARRFVADQLPHVGAFAPTHRAMAWIRDKDEDTVEILGGVVLCRRGGGYDAELSIAILPECKVTRSHIKDLFFTAFTGFGLTRLTCFVARKNSRARRFVERLGFRHEGTLKRGYDGVQAAIVYGMTKEDCRWINNKKADI